MTTPPLSASLVSGLKGPTAWRFDNRFGTAFEPRFFCCTDPNTIDPVEGKEPVAIIELFPNPIYVGDSACFDGSLSYDPDGSITGYSWTFESGASATSTAASGNISWATAGTYEVQLVVTDGTSLQSTPAIVEVEVFASGSGEYYAGSASGVWYTENSGCTWEERSGALSGSALVVNDVKVDPSTRNYADGFRVVWIGTACGIYASLDGDTWNAQSPSSVSNAAGDSPAPSPLDLSYDALAFAGNKLYATANWDNSGGSSRAWLFYTEDYEFIRGNLSSSASWGEF